MGRKSNLKGRATAKFAVVSDVTDGVITITVTADATVEDTPTLNQSVNGTVALGKAVAELGKSATPITASERKLTDQLAMYADAGLSEAQAKALASKVNGL